MRGGQHSRNWHGRSAARILLALLAAWPALDAAAQRTPGVGGSGTGGSAGVIAPHPMPPMAPAIAPPVLTPPVLAPPVLAPPLAAPLPPPVAAPAAPARAVRFRCEVAPQAEACREPGAPDGGGEESECNCARDYCRTTETGTRVCEKLQ